MLGHAFRRDMADLVREPTVDKELLRPQQMYKRIGKPRYERFEDLYTRFISTFMIPTSTKATLRTEIVL